MGKKKRADRDDQDHCVPAWGEHAGMTDTGRRGINPLTGDTFQVWTCQCRAKTLDVFPSK